MKYYLQKRRSRVKHLFKLKDGILRYYEICGSWDLYFGDYKIPYFGKIVEHNNAYDEVLAIPYRMYKGSFFTKLEHEKAKQIENMNLYCAVDDADESVFFKDGSDYYKFYADGVIKQNRAPVGTIVAAKFEYTEG